MVKYGAQRLGMANHEVKRRERLPSLFSVGLEAVPLVADGELGGVCLLGNELFTFSGFAVGEHSLVGFLVEHRVDDSTHFIYLFHFLLGVLLFPLSDYSIANRC